MNYRLYEWKIIYVFIVVFALIQIGAYMVLTVSNENIARENAGHDLQIASDVMRNLVLLRSRQLALAGQVIAADATVREAIATGDRLAMEATLQNNGFRIQAAAMLLTDMNRNVIAYVSGPASTRQSGTVRVNPAILQSPLPLQLIAPMDSSGEVLHQIVTIPINAPQPVGWLSIGFPMGDPLWQALGGDANANYAFFARIVGTPWKMHASTFPTEVGDGMLEQFISADGVAPSFESGQHNYLLNMLPLVRSEGLEVIGVMGKSLDEVMGPFDQLQTSLMRWMLASVALSVLAVFLLTRLMVGPLNTLAHLDTLTGVANRRLLDMSIGRLCMKPVGAPFNSFAVLLLDMNDFKQINDTRGHDAGDQVLRIIGRRLKAALRKSDLIARYGGDEFAVLLHGATRESTRQVMEGLMLSLQKPMQVDGREFPVRFSIGAALAPQDGTEGAELLRNADQAMYAAKKSPHAFVFFDEIGEPEKVTGRLTARSA
ncbi:MAG: diguanylate cyclase [Gammaproteobacteria bacterium]|nr:diguanylate cyclase [Gammaproteobacteria bacterium]